MFTYFHARFVQILIISQAFPSQNMKLGIFTSLSACSVQKSAMQVQSCFYAFSTYCVFAFLVAVAVVIA